MKTDVGELKESLSFTQNDIDQRFSNINEKVQSLEKELVSTKESVGVIQIAEPAWSLEIGRKLVDLDPRETWEECKKAVLTESVQSMSCFKTL